MGTPSIKQTKQIQVINKIAVRILTGSTYNSHTEPLFKQTNPLKVNGISKLNEINFYYKLVNKLLFQLLHTRDKLRYPYS